MGTPLSVICEAFVVATGQPFAFAGKLSWMTSPAFDPDQIREAILDRDQGVRPQNVRIWLDG
jgi:hypothetical protein